jgi:hypothetical protein
MVGLWCLIGALASKNNLYGVMTRYAGKREKPVFMRVPRGNLYTLTRAYARFFRFVAIKNFVMDLSNKNYKKIEEEKLNGRLNIIDLENVIGEYGKTLMPLPEEAFEIANVYNITQENRIDVYIPLWTKEEGRSDLTISIICYLRNNNPVIEINDLRIL